jgi:hypothetical protein
MSGLGPEPSAVSRRAWELHRANGHPPGYDGPCWGPTEDEIEEARRQLDSEKR